MKVQCDLCREIVVGELTVVGDTIEVHCPACDKRFTVETVGTPPRAPAAVDGPSMTCPKCGDAQPTAKACRRCGLLAERMDAYEPPSIEASPELVAAWEALEGRWDDRDAHAALLLRVTDAAAYPWAAQRYRAAARARPDDRIASEQLGKIARMTEASMRTASTRRDEQGPTPYKNVILLLGALIVLLVLVTVVTVVGGSFLDSGDPPPKPRPANHRK